MDYINIKFDNKDSVKVDFKNAKLVRLNHPNNCLTMDIKSLIDDLRGMKQIQFNFHKSSEYEVEVKIEDSKYSLSRAFRNNKFASTGSRLILEASEKGIIRYELIELYMLSNYACFIIYNINIKKYIILWDGFIKKGRKFPICSL